MTYYTVIYQDRGGSPRPDWWFFYVGVHKDKDKAQADADYLKKKNSHRPFVAEVFQGRIRDASIECDRRNRRTNKRRTN